MPTNELTPEEIRQRANERWLKGGQKINRWTNKDHPWKTGDTMSINALKLKKKKKDDAKPR